MTPIELLAVGDAAHIAESITAGVLDPHLGEIGAADLKYRGGRGIVIHAIREREARIASGYDLEPAAPAAPKKPKKTKE